MAKENTHEDILVNTTPDFALQKLQGSADSSLYTQMLRIKASIRKVPQQHKGRASAKDRVHDLERQVAELQQQKSTLTEETENLQCRQGDAWTC